MKRIEGKIAIVTGAGAGIGKAVALRFAQEGAHVIAADVTEHVLAVVAEPSAHTGRIEGRICDISNAEHVAQLMEFCRARYGRLDILVNNAGIGTKNCPRLHEVTLEQWDRVIDVNQRGAFLAMKYAIPLMLAGGGSIINTASVGAFVATKNSIAYLASKGAMLMMTRAAALEYRSNGIRVNAICPGMTRTSIFDGLPEDKMAALLARTEARMIEPDEVANLALFLASDESKAITGASYVIDDGRTAGS